MLIILKKDLIFVLDGNNQTFLYTNDHNLLNCARGYQLRFGKLSELENIFIKVIQIFLIKA